MLSARQKRIIPATEPGWIQVVIEDRTPGAVLYSVYPIVAWIEWEMHEEGEFWVQLQPLSTYEATSAVVEWDPEVQYSAVYYSRRLFRLAQGELGLIDRDQLQAAVSE